MTRLQEPNRKITEGVREEPSHASWYPESTNQLKLDILDQDPPVQFPPFCTQISIIPNYSLGAHKCQIHSLHTRYPHPNTIAGGRYILAKRLKISNLC